MRDRRTPYLLVLAALGVMALPVIPAATAQPSATGARQHGDTAGLTRLARTTTVVADRAARGVVELPRPVTVQPRDGNAFGALRGVDVVGGGRVRGVALVSSSGRAGLVQFGYRTCFSAGCTRSTPGYPDQWLSIAWTPPVKGAPPGSDAGAVLLPAGVYDISVYSDDAPVRVTLHLPELTGRAHLRLRLARNFSVTSPAEHPVGVGAAAAGSQAWATGSVGTDVTILGFAHINDVRAHVSNNESWCVYPGAGPPGGVLLPDCPGGSGLSSTITFVTLSFKGLGYGLLVTIGPGSAGTYYQGYDDRGVQVVDDVHDTFFWADAGPVVQ